MYQLEMLNTNHGSNKYLGIKYGGSMEIKLFNKNIKDKVYHFLENVKGLVIDDNIVNNASVMLEEDEILGMISFEKFGYIGLIRYFIFQRTITDIYTIELLNNLMEKARNEDVTTLISIINNLEVEEIFVLLGFQEVDKENVFFDETIFSNTEYKDSKVFIKKI